MDIGKAELVCCSRVPSPDRAGRRLQEVTTYSTMTRSLQGMADRLLALGVTRVVMEATSDYWKPAFYLLEAAGFEVWLVNAKDVKHLPGRPKTDRLDAVWLCKVAERQMIRPSFVPPKPIRRLRDLTRYLASWARFAPSIKESAGRHKGSGATGHGNRYLAGALGEAAASAAKTDTFLGERYRRIARRRGKRGRGSGRPLHPGHHLAPAVQPRHDLGADYYENRNGTRAASVSHVRRLQALGYRVTLEPVA